MLAMLILTSSTTWPKYQCTVRVAKYSILSTKTTTLKFLLTAIS